MIRCKLKLPVLFQLLNANRCSAAEQILRGSVDFTFVSLIASIERRDGASRPSGTLEFLARRCRLWSGREAAASGGKCRAGSSVESGFSPPVGPLKRLRHPLCWWTWTRPPAWRHLCCWLGVARRWLSTGISTDGCSRCWSWDGKSETFNWSRRLQWQLLTTQLAPDGRFV